MQTPHKDLSGDQYTTERPIAAPQRVRDVEVAISQNPRKNASI
jgi:hypothetical protein